MPNYTNIDEALLGVNTNSTPSKTKQTKTNAIGDIRKDYATETKKMYNTYKSENKKEITIAPMYAAYFGNIMTVMINGISIRVPCNGKRVTVPETFAAEIERRLNAINTQLNREKVCADTAFLEQSPGALELI